MKLTCGIFLITRTGLVLIAHATAMSPTSWSIPKGMKDDGESELDAAIREMREESSIDLSEYKDKIEPIGRFRYDNGKKTLSAFVLYEKDCPNVDFTDHTLFCASRVSPDLGGYPENDAFRWVPAREATSLIHHTQARALSGLLDKL